MMQRANRSLYVDQGPSQNFVPKPTYLLELSLLVFRKIQQKLVNKGSLQQMNKTTVKVSN